MSDNSTSYTEKKDVAIIFDDLTEYFVMRPVIDDMIKNEISVDIIVPKDSGYNNLAAHTKKKIKEDGYKVMDDCDKKTQYKILLTPYPNMSIEKRINFIWHIKYPYGPIAANKPDPVYSVGWNINYDAIVCFNTYEKGLYGAYGVETYPVPYWRFAKFKKDKKRKTNKYNLLILPTFGKDGCIELLNKEAIKSIKEKYNIISKAHHRLDFHPNERENLQKLKQISDEFYTSDISIEKLLSRADVVLSDNSGAIFDSICAGVPVAIASANPNSRAFNGINTYQYELIEKNIIPHSKDSNNIRKAIDLAITKNYINKQKKVKENLFLPIDSKSPHDFTKIILQYINKPVDNRKILHNLLIRYYYHLKINNANLLKQKQELERQNKKLLDEKEEIKRELDNLLLSKSWKLTSPLRKISSIKQNRKKN